MLSEMLLRFLIGGFVVCLFSALGDLFSPKSFSGIFGAAPSVALATLGMTISRHGGAYAAVEGRSLLMGAVALFVYSQATSWLLMRRKWHSVPAALASLSLWFFIAFSLWSVWSPQ